PSHLITYVEQSSYSLHLDSFPVESDKLESEHWHALGRRCTPQFYSALFTLSGNSNFRGNLNLHFPALAYPYSNLQDYFLSICHQVNLHVRQVPKVGCFGYVVVGLGVLKLVFLGGMNSLATS